MNALIVVDVQNDFIEGGSLAVEGGQLLAEKINKYIDQQILYDYLIATQDWHIDPAGHFAQQPDFQAKWPPHCVAKSHGAKLAKPLKKSLFDTMARKGMYSAGYSGFDAVTKDLNSLDDWLKLRGINQVTICGIATDFCVVATALDAVDQGYQTNVLADYCIGVDQVNSSKALWKMVDVGINIK